jgi:hypothetical protein
LLLQLEDTPIPTSKEELERQKADIREKVGWEGILRFYPPGSPEQEAMRQDLEGWAQEVMADLEARTQELDA